MSRKDGNPDKEVPGASSKTQLLGARGEKTTYFIKISTNIKGFFLAGHIPKNTRTGHCAINDNACI